MAEPRAQRAVAPTDVPSSNAGGRAASGPGSGFAPDDPLILFSYATLRRELDVLVATRPEHGAAPTPEQIHQLRVAARRLRVGLRLFRRMLPSREVTRLRAELKWFARALGEVRDLDVYAENFRAYAQQVATQQRQGLGSYELYLRRARAEARGKLAALFADPRCAALFDTATYFLAAGPSDATLRRWYSLTVRDGIRQSIRKSLGRVRRLGNRLSARSKAADIHQLRIRAKRLRYELEFFARVYPALKEPAKATKALQDLLGAHQDCYTASARLRRYAATLSKPSGEPTPLPPALVELRRSQLRLARDLRQTFADQWQQFLAAVSAAPQAIA
jgi:CHAD domain-containing protein